MKNFRFLLWVVLLGMSLSGHSADSPLVGQDTSTERERIAQQRAQYEAIFEQKQQSCYQRFAVSDCLRQVRRERRVVLDELRHHEVLLNDLDRQTSAAAESQRIQINLSPERQQELELQRQQALKDALERQTRSEEKKAIPAKPAVIAASAVVRSKPVPGREDASSQLQRYNEKLLEAQQRKADKTESLIEKEKSGAAKPLPIPAGY